MTQSSLLRQCLAEIVGTFMLAFFGTGAVFVAVLTGALVGLFQVAIVWGIAIALAIYAVSAISGAHLNPAVTIAASVFRDFSKWKIAPFIASQILGAFLASCVLYAMFSGVLTDFEVRNNITRGEPGSQKSAMVFGEYSPNPAIFGTDAAAFEKVTLAQAFTAEAVGTALLLFFIFAITDPRNRNRPDGTLFAPAIGLTVAALICLIAPLTQAGFNPARDFGPRLFSYFAGWKSIAIPGPRGEFFTVYILAPIVGGLIGALVYDTIIRPRATAPEAS